MFRITSGTVQKSTAAAACWDIVYPGPDLVLPAGSINKIHTGIMIYMAPGMSAKLESRSSLAALGLVVLGGRIDSDYRFQWIVIMHNLSSNAQTIRTGDRIAQFGFEYVYDFPIKEEGGKATILKTVRSGGLGSTGN